MLVYFNGDSFTAGVGSADHIFPGYPGTFTDAEVKAQGPVIKAFKKIKDQYYKSKFLDYRKLFEQQNSLEFFDKAYGPGSIVSVSNSHNKFEKQYAYPAELERLDSSIKVINNAHPGASMGGIVKRTVLDLLEFKKQNVKVDLVVIQLTSLYRYEIFDCEFDNLIHDRPHDNFNSAAANKISDAVMMKYSDNDFTIKFLYELISLKETVLSITGREPLIIDSMNSQHLLTRLENLKGHVGIVNPDNLSVVHQLIEHSLITKVHPMFMQNQANKLERPYAYDGHVSAEVHKLTAQELIKLL
jgi:hypothetical protein